MPSRCCTGPWPRGYDKAHPPGNYRCPLGRLQPQVTDLEEVKRTGWREQHILVVSPEDERLDWVERELLKQIGERLYGRREKGHVGS